MKHKTSWILAIVLVIAGCVLRFAMPGHDFLGYTLWGIAVLVLLWARLHRVGRTVLSVLVCAGLIVFAVFEIPVVRDARTDTGAHPNAIIVLGAGVNGSTRRCQCATGSTLRWTIWARTRTRWPSSPAVRARVRT